MFQPNPASLQPLTLTLYKAQAETDSAQDQCRTRHAVIEGERRVLTGTSRNARVWRIGFTETGKNPPSSLMFSL
jgi:hypothetical protein